MNWDLAFNLLMAHTVADFYLQNDAFCKKKTKTGFRGRNLYIHTLCVFLLSAAACWDVDMLIPAAVIAVVHMVLDGVKAGVERRHAGNGMRLYSFIADQALHIAVILIFASLGEGWEEPDLLAGITPVYAAAALAMLVLAKPANLAVGLLFRKYTIGDASESSDSFHSGRLIGTMERWLILILILLSQYEVIGFLVAAKSILRFNETAKGTEKSEYVLVGTLASFLMALAAGVAINALL